MSGLRLQHMNLGEEKKNQSMTPTSRSIALGGNAKKKSYFRFLSIVLTNENFPCNIWGDNDKF